MKRIVYIAIAAVTIAGLGWAYYAYASFLPTYSRTVAESVLIDQTEPFIVQPTVKEILSPLGMPEHKWENVQLYVRTFSEYKYTVCYSVSLPGQFFLLTNPDDRDKDIAKFRLRLDTVIQLINNKGKGYPKSSIYASFIEEVNRVAGTKADVKSVIVYSDLCENTEAFSVYKDYALLKNHPKKVKELMSQYGKPGNLLGLTIYVLYKPETEKDNEYFTLMSGFYKKLFEDAGAEIYIGANLISDNKF